jgi:hypothetical protein
MESSAGRIAVRIQALGAGFDPEILSLPGGSFIAVVLWLYAGAAATVHRAALRRPAAPHRPPFAAAAACTCCCGQK